MVTGAIAFAPALSWLGATPLLPLGGRPRRGCWSLALSAEAWILATKSASLVSSLIVSISALTSYLSRKKPTHGALERRGQHPSEVRFLRPRADASRPR